MQFDFWISGLGNEFKFGIANSLGNNLAMVVNSSGQASIATTSPSSVVSTSPGIQLTANNIDPYRYRAEIKYIQNISATLEISQRIIGPGEPERFVPVGSKSINLIGVNLINMNSLYIPAPAVHSHIINGVTVPPALAGDGEYTQINANNYIDHITISGLSACP
jgi:hypothetical protein